MQTFEKTILKLHARKLIPRIKIVEFIWINPPTETSVQKGVLANTDIKMVFSKNDPFYFNKEKNYLKVAMYAWDGNAFPDLRSEWVVNNKYLLPEEFPSS